MFIKLMHRTWPHYKYNIKTVKKHICETSEATLKIYLDRLNYAVTTFSLNYLIENVFKNLE